MGNLKNEIIVDETLKENESIVHYNAFLEIFKKELIDMIAVDGVTKDDAIELWNKAHTEFNLEIYGLMVKILETTFPQVIVTKLPMVDSSSIAVLKIKSVSYRQDEEFVFAFPPCIMPETHDGCYDNEYIRKQFMIKVLKVTKHRGGSTV